MQSSLFEKTRKRSKLITLILILSVFLSFLTSQLNFIYEFFFVKNKMVVAKVDKQNVYIQDYQNDLNAIRQRVIAQFGSLNPEFEKLFVAEQTWIQTIKKILYQKELKALGVTVSAEERIDMIQGKYIHPYIQRSFIDKKTKEFDVKKLVEYLEKLSEAPLDQKLAWQNFENYLVEYRKEEKFIQLFQKSIYENSLERMQQQNLYAYALDIEGLYIPFTTIPEVDINLSETFMKDYFHKHQKDYPVKESRDLAYVTLLIEPSEEDIKNFQKLIQQIYVEFKGKKSKAAWAMAITDGNKNQVYKKKIKRELLPKELQKTKREFKQNEVLGPFTNGNVTTMYKVINVQNQQYDLIMIEKFLTPSEETKEEIFRRANQFLANNQNEKTFHEKAKQLGLKVHTAKKMLPDTSSIQQVPQSRPIIQWLYQEAKTGKISQVFDCESQYVVAVMTHHTQPGFAEFKDVQDLVKEKCLEELKSKKLLEEIKKLPYKSLEDLQKLLTYKGKLISQKNLKFSDNHLPDIGKVKYTVGNAFSLKKNQLSHPIVEKKGIILIRLKEKKKDSTPNSNTYQQALRSENTLYEAIKESVVIKDYRHKFF